TAYTETRLALIRATNAADGLRRDLDRIATNLKELDRRAIARSEEGDRLRGSIAESEATETALAARLDSERTGTDELQRTVTEAEQRVLEARALIADTEKTLRGIRHQREEALQRQNAADLRLTEIITRQDAIAERLEDEHGLTLEAAAARLPEAVGGDDTFDSAAARAEIPRLREQIRTLGAVNALALESYEEEQERLTFLKSQQADLQAAEQSLLDTIEEINTTASRRFSETFEAVRAAFQRLFADLFGENATADLILSGDDPLEAPVEITARPKGKKPSTINQLSGGEKTLTAIALLFAIYLVKPSPFCILDEVDAPLDDANIARFMDLIRAFVDSTQFILVTHNKLTMEAADRMYGITMPEAGVSRLVGVRFDEAVSGEAITS
ncbi:MAG: AAA family ATPase, partial [Rhodothermaceae bacterium]|nr:AAA family ATPase [Rhodothermaceae bacterium]